MQPVRDAMARLVGERLLDVYPGGGFRLPLLHEQGLRDLLNWHAHLLRLILRERRSGWALSDMALGLDKLDPRDTAQIADATAALFGLIAECSENREHVEAIRAADARLHLPRLAEWIIPDRVQELQAVAAATVEGSQGAMKKAIWTYQRRRLRRVSEIVRIAGMS